MTKNLLLKECLDAFLKSLEEDASFPNDLLQTLKDLRDAGKLTKGNHLKDTLTAYTPRGGAKQ